MPITMEHVSKRLAKSGNDKISSAILSHLVDSGHKIDQNEAFDISYRVPFNKSKRIRLIEMGIRIRLARLGLCVQKSHTELLALPWPVIGANEHIQLFFDHNDYAVVSHIIFLISALPNVWLEWVFPKIICLPKTRVLM